MGARLRRWIPVALLVAAASAPGVAGGQAARDVEPVVLTGGDLPAWSRTAAVVTCAPYPSGTTGDRDAHNGTTVVPPDPRAGIPVGDVVAFHWTGLGFQEIPVQIDERYPYCLSNPPSAFSFYSGTDKELTYAYDTEAWKKTAGACMAAYPPGVGPTPDPVPTLDDDDEIVLMASDAGLQAPLGVIAPPGTTSGQALALVDPLDRPSCASSTSIGAPADRPSRPRTATSPTSATPTRTSGSTATASRATPPRSWASATPTTALAGTVCRTATSPDYPPDPDGTPRASTDRFVRDGVTVATRTYQWRASGRWMVRGLRVAKPGMSFVYGPDLLDRWKGRAFQQSPDSTISLVGFEDEQVNWEANSALLGERIGPVRAMRETWGADSGTNVTKTETFYRDAVTYRYHVRVHPIPPDGLYTSWDYNHGVVVRYYNTLKTGGVPVDGQNDDVGQVDGVFGVPAFFDAPDPTFSVPSALLNWEQVAGAGDAGSLVYIVEFKGATTAVNPAVVPYYRDDAGLDDGTGDDPVPRPWPGEPSTDPRVRAGYVAANGGTPYEQLACAERQGAWGAHGVHYFFSGDSDNAASPEVLTEIDAQQWQFVVPTAAPANVGQPYANTVIAPLATVAVPLGLVPSLLPPSASDGTVVTDRGVAAPATLAGSDLDTCDLQFEITAPPSHGALGTIANAACALGLPSTDTASVLYTPTAGFAGDDAFTYRVTDALGQAAAASVRVTVKPLPPPVCASGPRSDCRRPVRPVTSPLKIKNDAGDFGDRLAWKWTSGAATTKADFGSPTTATTYQLCVFDAAGRTVARASAPAGGDCGGRPCWRETASQFAYKSRDRQPNGKPRSSVRVKLKPGPSGRAKLQVQGRGVHLGLAPLPAGQPVTVQLESSDRTCWQATYSAPAQRNDAGQLRDKAD